MFTESRQPSRRGLGRFIGAIGLSAFAFAWSGNASAHIVLISPPSWVVEDSLGNPQKGAPCGGDDGLRTGIISTYRAGSTIEVKWQEAVGHPGHFRIALARDRGDLFDPVVETTNGDGVTGVSLTAAIMDPPRYPVLMDGLFPRPLAFAPEEDPFSVQVELPQMTCERCTLQVVQFMANHVPGYFYHHCADLRIVPADADVPDAALGPSSPLVPEAGVDTTPVTPTPSPVGGEEGGCALGVSKAGFPAFEGALLLVGLVTALRRSRRN